MSALKTPAKANEQGTPQTQKRPMRVAVATDKGTMPILFAAWEHVPGAVSLTEFMDQIHRQLRIKHPEVADQIKTLERREPEAPEPPEEPDIPPEGANPEETIFAYHKRYVESMRKLVDTGFDPLEDDMEAIKFVESLPSEMFGEWQVSLVNREHDAQIAGDAESPWPRTVSEAHTIATSRVSSHTRTKQRYELDMPTISTVNKAVGRGADSQGRGGGTRYTEDGSDDHITRGRTHADKPDKGTKECRVCEGILNHMTEGQRHWQSQCPVLLISTKKKAEVFSELFSIKKNEEDEPEGTKTGSAKSAFSRARWSLQEDEDSDDSSDVPRHMVIMGSAGR